MNRITIQEPEEDHTFSELPNGSFFALADENVFYIKVNDYSALSCYVVHDVWELIHVEPCAPVIRYDADITLSRTEDN